MNNKFYMRKCWANCYGGCSDKITHEHLISKSLFNEKVTVKGFSWCRDKEVEIGINSLSSKILCKKHNNDLSIYDSEMVKHWQITDEIALRIQKIHKYGFRKKEFPYVYTLNGLLLERWFCKTLMNICMVNEEDGLFPVSGIIPILFHNELFQKPFGLNLSVKIDQEINTKSTVQIIPLFNTIEGIGKILCGGLFKVKGFNYLLIFPTASTKDNVINGQLKINLPENYNGEWDNPILNWHNQEMKNTLEIGKNEYLIHKVKYKY